MKINQVALVIYLLVSVPGFSIDECSVEFDQTDDRDPDRSRKFNDLPDEIKKIVLLHLDDYDRGRISCCDRKMHALVQVFLINQPDTVRLIDGSLMKMKIALKEGYIAEIIEIKNIHSLLNSSRELRSAIVKAVASRADVIAGRQGQDAWQKQEERADFQCHILNLGLLSRGDERRTASQRLADVVLMSVVWSQLLAQVLEQVNSEVWFQSSCLPVDQIDSQIGADAWTLVWDQVQVRIFSMVSDKLWDKVWNPGWTKINSNVSTEVKKSIRKYFHFSKQKISSYEILSAIDHAFIIYQGLACSTIHSPKFRIVVDDVVKSLEKDLKSDQIDEILERFEVPDIQIPKTEAFLSPLRHAVAKTDSLSA